MFATVFRKYSYVSLINLYEHYYNSYFGFCYIQGKNEITVYCCLVKIHNHSQLIIYVGTASDVGSTYLPTFRDHINMKQTGMETAVIKIELPR